jgi:hypothetical protein
MVEQEQARQEKAVAKTASIVTGTTILKVGGKQIRVPVTVEIAKVADLKPNMIRAGPTRRRFGTKDADCYIVVDAQRLTFGMDGKLL